MIRPLTQADFPEYQRMRRALWPDCSDAMHQLEIAEQFNQPDAAVFVHARNGHSLGAFIELSVRDRVDGSMEPRVAYIEGWYVDPDLRGQAIGRTLVEAAESWARQNGFNEIASDAELENEASIEAHTKLGFKETFRLVHFLKSLKNHSTPNTK